MTRAQDGVEDPRRNGAHGDLVRQLRETVSSLAQDVRGPLRRVSLQLGDAAVELEWESTADRAAPAAGATAAAAEPAPAADADAEQDEQTVVRSPMVGTFYHAPAPGEAPFVSVGGVVEPDTVVGIVEAMKLMNQITAEHSGVVRSVLVPDGKPVEFEQPLLVLDPLTGEDGESSPNGEPGANGTAGANGADRANGADGAGR